MAAEETTTKRVIASHLAQKFNISQVLALKVVQGTFDEIIDILAKDGRLELRNFGVFIVKTRKARPARNPRTGTPVMIPKRRVVTFKPGAVMLTKIK
jgi:nucleoid DNA-binding protein